ncbi:hypothetical protein JOD64_000153 [Micromonospora luteifusca]|uniref:PT repeat-containing protein n=1 Tax=Micromonospora luteifusca TaxID=709860 RepID=A0ABS2LL74_9ACTN|nr:hypothetical protein [Micromonospora luteifusca]MBM7488931.1 hypothetical protein [Micromonospora luteifusca]
MTARYRRLAAVLTTTASAVLLLAACGGGSDDGDTSSAAGGAGNAFAAYQECLRDNGVTLPTLDPSRVPGRAHGTARPSGFPTARPSGFPTARPSGFPTARASGSADPSRGPGRGFPGGGRPEGVDEQTWQKAQQTCASVRPSGRPNGFGRPGGSGSPDGRPGGSGDGRATAYRTCLSNRGLDPDRLDSGDAKTREAVTACAVLSPSPTP